MTKNHGGLSRRSSLAVMALGGAGLLPAVVRAAGKDYGPGVSDTEIKIGNTMPYSGPASAFGTVGRAQAAYHAMINAKGGVNGRKINFMTLDDGYSPPKAVELVRRLVEQEDVLAMFGTLGTPSNAAMQKYLNEHKVPQFFLFSGAARFRDPKTFPWTMGGDLAFINETTAFARFILAERPAARIAVLYQNDDFGKDHLAGLRAGLGADAATRIVKVASYEATDATVDSQIVELKESGADVLMTAAVPKFAAQAIRKVYEIGWKPLHLLAYPAASIPGTFKPAGLEASTGVVTAEFVKVPGDPAWDNDPEMIAYLDFAKTYAPDLNPTDKLTVFGYYCAAATVKLLAQCGDTLTRANLLDKITHLQNMAVPMLLPGVTMSSTPENYSVIRQMQIQRFNGSGWDKIGGVVEG
jgi:ABC-type branched-subunit amino acid transport system substrate-binding protein